MPFFGVQLPPVLSFQKSCHWEGLVFLFEGVKILRATIIQTIQPVLKWNFKLFPSNNHPFIIQQSFSPKMIYIYMPSFTFRPNQSHQIDNPSGNPISQAGRHVENSFLPTTWTTLPWQPLTSHLSPAENWKRRNLQQSHQGFYSLKKRWLEVRMRTLRVLFM